MSEEEKEEKIEEKKEVETEDKMEKKPEEDKEPEEKVEEKKEVKQKPKCEICNRTFSSEEGLEHHNKDKHPQNVEKETHSKSKIKISPKKIIWIVIALLAVFGIYYLASGSETLPPTTMQGHIEVSPVSHVLKEPMKLEVQKHMLEHADGGEGALAGIVINYNCNDYSCESDLISKLEAFAGFYPINVYVAPFKGMDAKIALTKLNKIEILEEFDSDKIHTFISGRVPTNEELGITTPASSEENTEETTSEEDVAPIVQESVKEFSMTAKQWEFIPNEITVNEGDTVKLIIESIDVNHGILLNEFGVNTFLSPGNTVEIEFVADKKGEFTFFCNVSCGAGHSTMRGKLIVE